MATLSHGRFLEDKDDDDDVAEWQQDVYKRQGLLQDTGALTLMLDLVMNPPENHPSASVKQKLWPAVFEAIDVGAEGALTSTDGFLSDRKVLMSLLQHTIYNETEFAKEVVAELFGDNRSILDDLFVEFHDKEDLALLQSHGSDPNGPNEDPAKNTIFNFLLRFLKGEVFGYEHYEKVSHDYYDIMSEICSCKGKAVTRAQDPIGEILFETSKFSLKPLPKPRAGMPPPSRTTTKQSSEEAKAIIRRSKLFENGKLFLFSRHRWDEDPTKTEQLCLQSVHSSIGGSAITHTKLKDVKSNLKNYQLILAQMYLIAHLCDGEKIEVTADFTSPSDDGTPHRHVAAAVFPVEDLLPVIESTEAPALLRCRVCQMLFELHATDAGEIGLQARDKLVYLVDKHEGAAKAPRSSAEVPPDPPDLFHKFVKFLFGHRDASPGKSSFEMYVTTWVERMANCYNAKKHDEFHHEPEDENYDDHKGSGKFILSVLELIQYYHRQGFFPRDKEEKMLKMLVNLILDPHEKDKKTPVNLRTTAASAETEADVHRNRMISDVRCKTLSILENFIDQTEERFVDKVIEVFRKDLRSEVGLGAVAKKAIADARRDMKKDMESRVGKLSDLRSTLLAIASNGSAKLCREAVDVLNRTFEGPDRALDVIAAAHVVFKDTVVSPGELPHAREGSMHEVHEALKKKLDFVDKVAIATQIDDDEANEVYQALKDVNKRLLRKHQTKSTASVEWGVPSRQHQMLFQANHGFGIIFDLLDQDFDDEDLQRGLVSRTAGLARQGTQINVVPTLQQCFLTLLQANDCHFRGSAVLFKELDNFFRKPHLRFPAIVPFVAATFSQCFFFDSLCEDVTKRNITNISDLLLEMLTTRVPVIGHGARKADTTTEQAQQDHLQYHPSAELINLLTVMAWPPFAGPACGPAASYNEYMRDFEYDYGNKRMADVLQRDPDDRNVDLLFEVLFKQNEDDRQKILFLSTIHRAGKAAGKTTGNDGASQDEFEVNIATANFLKLECGKYSFHPTAAVMCHTALLQLITMMMLSDDAEFSSDIWRLFDKRSADSDGGTVSSMQDDSLWFLAHCKTTSMQHSDLLLTNAKAAHIEFVRAHAHDEVAAKDKQRQLCKIIEMCIEEVRVAMQYLASHATAQSFVVDLMKYREQSLDDARWAHLGLGSGAMEATPMSITAFLQYALGSALPFLAELVVDDVLWEELTATDGTNASAAIKEGSLALLYFLFHRFAVSCGDANGRGMLQMFVDHMPKEGVARSHFDLWKALVVADEKVYDAMAAMGDEVKRFDLHQNLPEVVKVDEVKANEIKVYYKTLNGDHGQARSDGMKKHISKEQTCFSLFSTFSLLVVFC